jgi:hypothetical protein
VDGVYCGGLNGLGFRYSIHFEQMIARAAPIASISDSKDYAAIFRLNGSSKKSSDRLLFTV